MCNRAGCLFPQLAEGQPFPPSEDRAMSDRLPEFPVIVTHLEDPPGSGLAACCGVPFRGSTDTHTPRWLCSGCARAGRGAAPRAATEPPTPADFDAMSPEEFDAYLVRNGMDARIKTALAEPVTEPLTREAMVEALRTHHMAPLRKVARIGRGTKPTYERDFEAWADLILAALTPTSAPEPGS